MQPGFDAPIDCEFCERWNRTHPPFRVVGNTFYVGTAGLSAILVDTGDGLVLLDGGLPQSAALIDANIRRLGFEAADVDAILISHAHFDHVGGVAALQRLSGARVFTSAAGARPLQAGVLDDDDPQFSPTAEETRYPAVKRVAIIEDGSAVTVGGRDFTAVYTPGHTAGSITWTWRECEGENCLSVVYADSMSLVSVDGFRFSEGAPSTADVLRDSIARIAALDCDVLLSPHPFYFNMQEKLAAESDDNAFVDPEGCRRYAQMSLQRLDDRIAAEKEDAS